MKNITFDYNNAKPELTTELINNYQNRVSKIHNDIHNKTGKGNDFLGWVDLPKSITSEQLKTLKSTAEEIRDDSEVFISIGIGGSYLGARAVIEALTGSFDNIQKKPVILFAGHNLSSEYINEMINFAKGKKVYINVISKSGTTTEPGVIFRILQDKLNITDSKYIIATTDKNKGALRQAANEKGYKSFIIPDDVGGRFSVLTPVGLFPIAIAGIDIEALAQGAKDMADLCNTDNIKQNPAYQYAVARNILYNSNKSIEILVNYNIKLSYVSEWWKQLYGESEGKENKSLFPASCNFTTDLHSMGQWIQDGVRNIFETVIDIKTTDKELIIPENQQNLDGLNYLAGQTLSYVNQKAMEGTALAHIDGKVPNLKIGIPKLTPYYLGQLIYFFEIACAMSGYLLDVNPFDQPGVEAYKKNMFKLLGKPGY